MYHYLKKVNKMHKILLIILLLLLTGCQSGDEIEMTKSLVKQLGPMNAIDQAKAIKACETNEGWTGQGVYLNKICIQIRCVKKGL